MEEFMGKELNSQYYNNVFKNSKTYSLNPEEMKHYKLWQPVAKYIEKNNKRLIIDLGCGPGHFARVIANYNLFENNKYFGHDFSQVAIEQARERLQGVNNCNFFQCDLKNNKEFLKNYVQSDTIFTAFEFLEHVSFDRELIENIPQNEEFIFSLPSFDDPGHVRHFLTREAIIERYQDLLDIKKIFILGKHFLAFSIKK